MDPNATNWEHCLDYAAVSDIGMRRANNQDAMAVTLAIDQQAFQKRGHLFLVADGMGAHAAGEMASKLAADSIPLSYHKYADLAAPQALRKAVHDANDLIHRRGQSSEDFKGMGTTSTSLLLVPEGAVVAHVGDSRAYRLRGAVLDQLTFDHSLVWEMRATGQIPADQILNYVPKNIITRSLGPNPEVQIDLEGPFPIEIGDAFLLCSDGLSGQLKDKELGAILLCLPPQKAIRAMVDLGNLRGGPDNITVVVVRVTGPQVAKGTADPANTPAPAPAKARPVNPLVWTFLGAFALAALLMLAMSQWIPALVCAAGAAVAGVTAMVQHYGQSESDDGQPLGDGPLGRGPYTCCDAMPDPEVVGWLSDVARQLSEAATQQQWTVDWSAFHEFEKSAVAATEAGNLVQAVRDYCEAITFMMEQLRSQGRNHPNSDRVL